MSKKLLVAAISAVALLAQTPQIVEEKQVHVIGSPGVKVPDAGGFAFVSAEASFETSLVKGVPFTGDFVTESIQTLADGNRIKNSNTTSYARDGEGRTRREITINAIGPFSSGAAAKHIFIHDPVAKVDYVLDPQEKTARKISVGAAWTAAAPAVAGKERQTVFFNHRIEGPKDVVIAHGGARIATAERMPLPPGIVMQGHAGAVIASSGNANFKNDTLGKRMIEGVEAEGTRSTITIPAGQIGNDQALNTVSERWYSNELKTVVLTTRKDPRSGESNYKLTNLRRGEPAGQLFEVPSDYKIITEDIITEDNVGPEVIRMKMKKNQE